VKYKNIVVTGTDTEVGKTWMSSAMVRGLSDRGCAVRAVKPAESGCTPERSEEEEDGVMLSRAARQQTPAQALVRLREPLAPPVAADLEGVTLDAEFWMAMIRSYADQSDLVIVEGAGGLLSPLTWETTALEMAVELDAAAIVVAANRLGVLNHTRMTLWVLRAAGVDVLGVLLNETRAGDLSSATNLEALRRVEPDLPVLSVPHVDHWSQATPHLDEAISWILEEG
jgi:dethiobiotin synthetase